mmetsp:Transcript_58470/g.155584  ORF Transcript_58470/g.155584 Transcript_58470/m.155584 type:complete len:268 (+) Transcript_58470:2979-3782(+)
MRWPGQLATLAWRPRLRIDLLVWWLVRQWRDLCRLNWQRCLLLRVLEVLMQGLRATVDVWRMLLNKVNALLHRKLVGSCSLFIVGCSGSYRQASRFPTSKPAGEDTNPLPLVGLLSVPICALRSPVCRILASEDDQRLIRPSLHELWDFRQERNLIDGGHVHGAIDQSRSAVFAPKVHKNTLLTAQKVVDHLGVQVLDSTNGGNSVWQNWRVVRSALDLRWQWRVGVICWPCLHRAHVLNLRLLHLSLLQLGLRLCLQITCDSGRAT